MFKKKFRLNASEFKEAFNFGKVTRNSYFLIKTKENGLGYPRFAVVASKKISKKAVERNYLKRKFMHALAEKDVSFSPADYVFVLNSSAKDLQYKDLLQTINAL